MGDTCCRFFDADGRPIRGVVHDRVIAIELDQLAAIPIVVGVATGIEKAPGVRGAIRGGIIDGLITDASLALALLGGAGPVERGVIRSHGTASGFRFRRIDQSDRVGPTRGARVRRSPGAVVFGLYRFSCAVRSPRESSPFTAPATPC